MILLTSKTELYSKLWRSQIGLIKELVPDIVEVDISDDHNLAGQTIINIGNHQFAGSDILNGLAGRLALCDRLIALMDDYTSPPASQMYNAVRGKDNIIISSIPDILKFKTGRMFDWAVKDHYVNLNMLSWNPQPIIESTIKGLIYYGAYRSGRWRYFEKYLGHEATDHYIVTVSASRIAVKKYLDLNFMIDEVNKMDNLYTFLQLYEFSIYLEDEKTHTMYCSPANRFYECVSAGIPLFFDSNCQGTFGKAEIDIIGYIVGSAKELHNMDKIGIAEEQRKLWSRDYQGIVREDMKRVLTEIGVI